MDHRRATRRGSIEPEIIPVIVGLLLAVSIGGLARSGALGPMGLLCASLAASAMVVGLAWMTGALPFVDALARQRIARRMARRLGGRLRSESRPIWGGRAATAYLVEWEDADTDTRYTLGLHVSGVSLCAEAREGGAPEVTIDVREGKLGVEGEGAWLANRLIDEEVRALLDAIDRLKGGEGDLSLHLGGRRASIDKGQLLSARKTRRLVALGMPVIKRALALMSTPREPDEPIP